MHTTDGVENNVAKIAALFPNCVSEVKDEQGNLRHIVDYDKLKVELGEVVEGPEERYQFTWPGKRDAIRLANSPIAAALRPVREDSVDFDNTQNLYIEGDNLDVLKLLRETYLGKVKLIYIDPPYNTGNDFVYEDDFSQATGDYLANSGQYDNQGNRLVANTESNGRFHTDWLNMIYPRLKVSRDLLTDDGIIFISIDDNEVNNTIKVCNEVFGASNKIASLITINNPRGRQSDTFYATVHEYLLCYCKNKEKAFINGMPLTDEQKKEYSYTDNNGNYRLLGLRQRGVASLREDRPDMFFPIYVNPQTLDVSLEIMDNWVEVTPKKSDGREGRWMWGKQKCITEIDRLVPRMISKRGEFDIFVKDYLDKGDKERTRKFKSVLDEKTFNNQNGTQEVKALLGGDYMSFPKSMEYIKTICLMGSTKDSIILDFFSGSATTAHAVMQLNAEDGGDRKFIMVQLPEATDEKSEAYRAGFTTICEIGKKRIRCAGKMIMAGLDQRCDVLKRTLDRLYSAKPSATTQLLLTEDVQAAAKKFYKNEIEPKEKELIAIENQINHLDTGFRVLRLDSSNMEDVYYTPEKFDSSNLFNQLDNVKAERTDEDLLFQVMLELDIPLSAAIKREQIAGKHVFNVADGHLIATFDSDVNETTVKEIAKQHPNYFVMRDASAANDNVLDNFEQIFRHYSPDTTCKIL